MDIEELYKRFRECSGISTDTRKIVSGQMFFALKGDNFDGNTYIEKAFDLGAKYAVSDDASKGEGRTNLILVDSVLEILQALANHHRNQLDAAIIAITGTNGKTTTKELLYATLSQKYKVQKTKGNLNNHIGVPLTLLGLREDTEFAIVEMGANKRGDIKELCEIAEPDFGIITNIGQAHLEGFGSVEGIAQTKGELYHHLHENNGIAFVNAKDNILLDIAPAGLEMVLYNTNAYGAKNDAEGLLNFARPTIAKIKWIPTHLFGAYNLQNIIVGLELADYFEVDPDQATTAVSEYSPNLMRSQITKINDTAFYLDAYNANPSSMALGIAAFTQLEGDKIMILGDMKELGPDALLYHNSIIKKIPKDFNGELILIGEIFGNTKSESAKQFASVQDYINNYDLNNLRANKVFLKGSRSVGLERILTAFQEL